MTPSFSDPLVYNFNIRNNVDFSQTWALLDFKTKQNLLDLSLTPIFIIKASPSVSSAVLLQLSPQANTIVSGCTLLPDASAVNLTLTKSDIETLIVPSLVDLVAYYALKVQFSDALIQTYVKGQIDFSQGLNL